MKRPKPDSQAFSLKILHPGESLAIRTPVELTLENGPTSTFERRLPDDLPVGFHKIRCLETGRTTGLIIAPKACFIPDDSRRWGWGLQLYSLRSKKSWGIGDFADLRRFAQWSHDQLGTDYLLLNPLGAANPAIPQQPSPYYPSSRIYRNPLYLAVEEVGHLPARTRQTLANVGRVLNSNRLIDRDKIFRIKMTALRSLWKTFRSHPGFERYVKAEGRLLEQFATFCVLKEKFGAKHPLPARFSHPENRDVQTFATHNGNEIDFHKWLQWHLDRQFSRAAAKLSIIQDLPIGFDPAGADAWCWQDLLAKNVSVGAPPDEFNTQGQNWGIVPFIPEKLREACYEPFRQTVRACLAHSRGLRIDHVMGLFRLFWIPRGQPPKNGAYVRYPADELLAILAIESHCARAFIIGEDLGTVERGVRQKLRRRKIFSYRLLWFQPALRPKATRESLAAVTTHDLPTIAGLWSGSDLAIQTKLGLQPNIAATQRLIRRLRKMLKLNEDASVTEVIFRLHRHLVKMNSQVLLATLEDALGVEARPNMPGTMDEHPNWNQPLPQTLEAIQKNPRVRQLAKILDDAVKTR